MPSDLPGLLELYRLTFGRERTEEEFHWKLLGRSSPFDTIWVAATEERVVGQHAGIPMQLKLGDRTVAAMHAVEAMTHPDHRREGMLTELGGALYSRWRDQASPLIMGLPHAGWGSRAGYLGYRPAFPLRWLWRPLDPVALVKNKLRPGSTKSGVLPQMPVRYSVGKTKVASVTEADSRFDGLWARTGPSYKNAAVRDTAWVRWRYLDPSGQNFSVLLAEREGEPTGYIAYRMHPLGSRLIGRIADIFVDPSDRESLRVLVRAALSDMTRRGADSVTCLTAAGSPLHRSLRSHGFLWNRGEYQASFILLSDTVPWEAISNPSEWLLTGGDFDVI